jgi:CO/xanthine dehydrogenase Mo-binding subunit
VSAARQLRRRIVARVAAEWELPAKRINLVRGQAVDMEDPERFMCLADAFVLTETEEGLLSAVGNYNTPRDRHGEYRGGTIGASPAYSFTAHVAEVEVDAETGIVELVKVWVAHDCGRALSPRIVEGQMEGSVYMGAAEAIMEQHIVDPSKNGVHAGPSLLDYRMPTFADTPEIESHIVEAPDAQGPYGAKEAGEGPLHPIIPAISNAIYDAVGVRMNRTPFSPPRVLAAIEERRRREEAGELAAHKGGLS